MSHTDSKTVLCLGLIVTAFSTRASDTNSLRVVVKPSKTEVHVKEAFKVALRVENPTTTNQAIRVMNCSWYDHWQASNPQISWIGWDCPKNFAISVKIPPGDAYTNELEMLVPEPIGQKTLSFRMGFTPIGSPVTFWSAEVTIHVHPPQVPVLAARTAEKAPITGKRVISKWPNGSPLYEETYRIDGQGKSIQHGPATEYFENGKRRLELEYANRKRNGQLTEWDLDGTIIRQGNFKNDRETGRWTWWRPTGEKLAECTYSDGKIIGKKNYWLNGKLRREDSYNSAGELIQMTTWYSYEKPDKHTMEKQGTFKHGRKDGKWTYWNPDGTIKAEGEWKNGKPWNGICGVPLAGDAGSWGGLETSARYNKGKKVETK